jgi:hypothetical protein
MDPTPKCASCPLAGDARPCPSRTIPAPRFCALLDPSEAAHNPRYADVVVSLAAAQVLRPASGGASAPAPQLAEVLHRRSYLESRLLILGCDYRRRAPAHVKASCRCAGEVATCDLGRGTAIAGETRYASYRDCYGCGGPEPK